MLNLRRTKGQKIWLIFDGATASVEVIRMRGGEVTLGVDAPRDVTILRGEVRDRSANGGTDASVGREPESEGSRCG